MTFLTAIVSLRLCFQLVFLSVSYYFDSQGVKVVLLQLKHQNEGISSSLLDSFKVLLEFKSGTA